MVQAKQKDWDPKTPSGVGVGLRSAHFKTILETRPPVPWFEVLADNYLFGRGLPVKHLSQIREHYPMVLHSVGMSLGSTDPLNRDYLLKIRDLADALDVAWVSDHLCWCSVDGVYVPDLLPLPLTESVASHVAARISEVQEVLGRQILIENLSSYLTFNEDELSEPEFIARVAETADCLILLDVNNVYVSAHNHNTDPAAFLAALPEQRIRQMHLAGYEAHGTQLLDTHGHAVHPPVWQLYEAAIQRFGPIPACVEWDNAIPSFDVLWGEAQAAQAMMERCCVEFA